MTSAVRLLCVTTHDSSTRMHPFADKSTIVWKTSGTVLLLLQLKHITSTSTKRQVINQLLHTFFLRLSPYRAVNINL